MSDKPKDQRPRVVRSLEKRLDVAKQVRELEKNPVLDIVDIERLRKSVTRGLWFFLTLGLGFTSAGVQKFMAGDTTMSDPIWWACWLIEPALAGILITVLRWEAEMLARNIEIDSGWVTSLKWTLLTSTLLMNILSVSGDTSGGMIAAHCMVPLLVFMLAEVMPVIQRRCTQARREANVTSEAKEEPETTPATPVLVPAPRSAPASTSASIEVAETAPLPVLPVEAATPVLAAVAAPKPVEDVPADLLEAARFKLDHHRMVTGADLTADQLADRLSVEPTMAQRVLQTLTAPVVSANGSPAAAGGQ